MADKFTLVNAKGGSLTEIQFWSMLYTAPYANLNNVFSASNMKRLNFNAKYKPVKWDGYERPANYWRAKDGNCGIKFPVLNSLSEIGSKNWTYDYPQGGTSTTEPCNLQDFWYHGAYQHFATPIVSSGYQSAIKWNRLNESAITLWPQYNRSMADSPILGLDDVSGLVNKYYAVSVGNSPDPAMTVSSTSKLGEGGGSITITTGDIWRLGNGRTYLWFFISDMPVRWGEEYAAYGKYAIQGGNGYLNPVPLDIVQETPIRVDVPRVKNVFGDWIPSYQLIETQVEASTLLEVTFTNNSGSSYDLAGSSIIMTVRGASGVPHDDFSQLFINDSGTGSSVNTVSLTAYQTKTFYMWVNFETVIWPRPTFSASVTFFESLPSVSRMYIGGVDLTVK